MVEKILMDEEEQIFHESLDLAQGSGLLSLDLDLKIKKIKMKQAVFLNSESSVEDALNIFREEDTNSVLVSDKNNNLKGIFTENDFIKKVSTNNLRLNYKKFLLCDYMTKDPQVLNQDDKIAFAMNIFINSAINHIPISCSGEYKYVLTPNDLMHFFACQSSKSVLNLSPHLHRKSRDINGG